MQTMSEAAKNLAAASEVAHNNWAEAQRWKRLAERLTQELAERDAAADEDIEVRRGTVIFREGQHGY